MKRRSTVLPNQNYPKRKPHTRVSYEFIHLNILFCREDQQFYHLNQTSLIKDHIYRCTEDGCRCCLHILNEKCYINNAVAHNHGKKTSKCVNLCALNEMRRILQSVHNQLSPKQIFDDVIKRLVDIIIHILSS